MFSDEIKKLLVEVISSWQVLAVSGVLIIYVFLVNSVARIYRHPRPPRRPMFKPKPAVKEEAPAVHSNTEDLILEDEETEE